MKLRQRQWTLVTHNLVPILKMPGSFSLVQTIYFGSSDGGGD